MAHMMQYFRCQSRFFTFINFICAGTHAQSIRLGRQPSEAEVAAEVKAMRQKELEDRITARKQKSEGAQDARMEKIEALCAAQGSRLKKVEDMLTELHANMTRVSTPPLVEPLKPKQKTTKKCGVKPRPKQATSRPADIVVATPESSKARTGPSGPPPDDCTSTEEAVDDRPVVTMGPKPASTTADEEFHVSTRATAGEMTSRADTEHVEHVDGPEGMAEDGLEEGADLEQLTQKQDVEEEETEADDGVGSPAGDPHDNSDDATAPSAEKVFSPEADEEEIVDTVTTLSVDKLATDQVV